MKIGVLGGGQLGRMLALAGYPLSLRFRFFDPADQAPAGQVAEHIQAEYGDRPALDRFSTSLDCLTYEFENVPVESARYLAAIIPHFYPKPQALEIAQDRLLEKKWFQRLGIDTAPFVPVETQADLTRAVTQIGLPAVLKTRRWGYDGKGQFRLQSHDDVSAAWKALGGSPLLLEGFVAFDREMSIIAARNRGGDSVYYPLVENQHRDGILRLTLAPAPQTSAGLQAAAEEAARRVLESLDYVGVLTIELFEAQGRLLANEMACRVHNSGHWTIEGAETSQFENHLRAILDLPLGATKPLGCSAMLNLIGTLPDSAAVLAVPGAHLHLYGKTPRPGRKLGHITVCGNTPEWREFTLKKLSPLALD
jgi:5-(carboxyamino)imidazole ribonucleotide synthase